MLYTYIRYFAIREIVKITNTIRNDDDDADDRQMNFNVALSPKTT